MSFGNNVVFYRKKFGITQEALAEKLDVTRQTVSRWETDNAFPDMEKLLVLCDLFGCDMETLVRGNAEEKSAKENKEDLVAYDRHMNAFTAQITAGVTLILAGVTLLVLLSAFGIREAFGAILFLSCVTVAVALFVAGGVAHGNFMRDNPRMRQYPQERVRAFRRKMPYLFSGATALILIGVIAVAAMTFDDGYAPVGFTRDRWEDLSASVLLLMVTVAVGIFVATGMQAGKYDIKEYNRDCVKNGFAEELSSGAGTDPALEKPKESRAKKGERISGAICGVIMLTATAIYLIIGFIRNLWHPGWVVFPVGGICCAIVSTIIGAIYGEK